MAVSWNKDENIMIKLPDYDRSILSIASSVLNYYGVQDCPHKTLPEYDKLLKNDYKNVIVMLFDGLGVEAIKTHLDENSFLRKHLVCSISSVFPSTTTAATTSIQSGYAPIEHAWLGWDLYFKELDENVAVFRNTLQRNGNSAAKYGMAGRYIPYTDIWKRIEKANKDVKAYCVSPFSRYKAYSFDDVEKVVLKISKKKGKKYIYAYNPQPDNYMHNYGVGSQMAKETIEQINDTVESLCKKLEDSIVVVTADHGLVDSKIAYLDDYSEIKNMLKRPVSIEPRALSLFVKDEYKNVFKEKFESTFPNKFLILTKQEVYEKHLFGYGKTHPRVDEFLGDFLAIAISDLSIFNIDENETYIGMHAGLDEREMAVPFIAVEKKKYYRKYWGRK